MDAKIAADDREVEKYPRRPSLRLSPYTGTVGFTSSDPYPASLPLDYTFTPGDKGTHTFGAVFYTAGSQTLTVQDKTDGSVMGTATLSVTPASATQFLITAPTSVVSGMSFDLTVMARDAYGNVDTNYQGAVTFTSTDSDAGVILPGDYTFQSSDNGTHTFAGGVTLITPGDESLTATDTASSITGNTTVTVTSPAAPPGGRRAVTPLSPTVPVDSTARASVSPGGEVGIMDRLFALLNYDGVDVLSAPLKHSRLVEASRGLVDFRLDSNDA